MESKANSVRRIRSVGVIGAGVMGRGIAALVASAGVPVLLLDIPGGPEDRNGPARRGVKLGLGSSPPAFLLPDRARLVQVGNTEDDLFRLATCDWVIEVIPERPDLKQALFESLEEVVGPHTLITTNTSGIPMAHLTAGRGTEFRRRFFGTHFFNPPRVMHLVEVISGQDTDPVGVGRVCDFVDRVLGKGIVHAKDFPGFIANRLGIFGVVQAIRLTGDVGLKIGEVDALTGTLLGRPASAIFRTADLVGLDVLAATAAGIAGATGEDLTLPAWVMNLIEAGQLGAKSGAGFYRKEGKEILEFDRESGEYLPRELPGGAPSPDGLDKLMRRPLGERLTGALELPGPGGGFVRSLLARTFHHTLKHAAEVADDLPSVDRAMAWGFGWEAGPVEQMDLIGLSTVRELLAKEGFDSPELLDEAGPSFYRPTEGSGRTVISLTQSGTREPVGEQEGRIRAARLRASGTALIENDSAALLDMGEEVALLEFRSRMGTLGDEVVRTVLEALEWIDREGWRGVVVGHDGPRAFSAGANLKEMRAGARDGRWEEMDGRIRAFQNMVLSLRRSSFPVVVAPSGLTLAGGAELALHADQIQAHAELQIGLVEAGVGLLPAGGGTKELLFRFTEELERHGGGEGASVRAARRAFLLIATAEVSTSALHARAGGWLRDRDRITPNRDRLLSEARAQVVLLADAGYVAPFERRVTVPGDRAFGDLLVMTQAQREAGRATEHDAVVAREIAWVLCGGDGPPREMGELELMDLEREAFLRLLGMERTLERIEHMLETGKPLRN